MSYRVVRPGGEAIPNRKKSWYKGEKRLAESIMNMREERRK